MNNDDLPSLVLSSPRRIPSEPSPALLAGSLNVLLSDPALDPPGSPSLGLFVRVGFVRGELAGDADAGDGRGC